MLCRDADALITPSSEARRSHFLLYVSHRDFGVEWRGIKHCIGGLEISLADLNHRVMGCGMTKVGPPPEECPRVYMDVSIGGVAVGRIEIVLRHDVAPKTAENFRCLCTGEKSMSFKDSKFHSVIPGFAVQGGDFKNGDGSGGMSI